MNYFLAIDIGASSGRHILGSLEAGRIRLEEVYRFENRQVRKNGHDCWDLELLWNSILEGLKVCKKRGKIPTTMGVDTWAVDYVLLDGAGRRIGDPVAYRDGRTRGCDALVDRLVDLEELYYRTGIQKQSFNTIYQLVALKREHPDQLEGARKLLMLPDYFHFLLTGRALQEYTNATTTGLVNAREKRWDRDLLDRLELPAGLFGELSMPGTVVGHFLPEIRAAVGFDCTVVLPATHDTGSAFLAVPARDDGAVYLSSGTWSLLGVERDGPITTPASRAANFTNEGGAWYRFRYLKNIMGLWMIQSIRRELNGVSYVSGKPAASPRGHQWSFPELIEAARGAEQFGSVVEVDDPSFLAPESMGEAIRAFCRKTGQPVPETVGELMQCTYRSLARRYAQAVEELEALTGRHYTSINIVGGGCQDGYLNALTARATGLPVYAGPVEATALGNLMVQMIADGTFADLDQARRALRRSFEIQEVIP